MLFGLFVHATTLDRLGWLGFIPFISDQFRMATFFAVSAILSALVLQKRPPGLFVRKRLIMLIVPFVSGVFLLNPVTLWLIWLVHGPQPENLGTILLLSISNDGAPKPSNLVWHLHLWFLFSLAVYAIFTPTLNYLIGFTRAGRAFSNLCQWVPPALRVLFIAVTAAVFSIILRVAGELVYPQLYDWWLTRATLLNLTFFMTGILIAHNPKLIEIKFDVISFTSALFLILFLNMGGLTDGGIYGKLSGLAISQIINICFIFFLMWVFHKFAGRPNKFGDLLIASIYTVYIFHYILIYIVGVLLMGTGVPKFAVYSIAVAVSFLGGLILHSYICRVSVLSWLFNGKAAQHVSD